MGVRDRSIDWLRTEHWIGADRFNPIVASATTLTGIGANDPVMAEVATFGFGGFATSPNDDMACLDLQLPRLMNPDEEVGVRVVYTIDQGGVTEATDAVTWIVLYDQVDFGEVLVAPATALNTVLVNETAGSTTDRLLKRTARGVINAGVLDWTSRQGAISWAVENQATTDYVNDKVVFLGLLIDYYPKLCIDGNEDLEAFRNLTKA